MCLLIYGYFFLILVTFHKTNNSSLIKKIICRLPTNECSLPPYFVPGLLKWIDSNWTSFISSNAFIIITYMHGLASSQGLKIELFISNFIIAYNYCHSFMVLKCFLLAWMPAELSPAHNI